MKDIKITKEQAQELLGFLDHGYLDGQFPNTIKNLYSHIQKEVDYLDISKNYPLIDRLGGSFSGFVDIWEERKHIELLSQIYQYWLSGTERNDLERLNKAQNLFSIFFELAKGIGMIENYCDVLSFPYDDNTVITVLQQKIEPQSNSEVKQRYTYSVMTTNLKHNDT